MIRTTIIDGGMCGPVKCVEFTHDESERVKVFAQMEENFIDCPDDANIDKALAACEIIEDTPEDIENIAHMCRADYLSNVERHDPDQYLYGVIGTDTHRSELIEKEAEYENNRRTAT
jgi:hypothetical protein